MTAVPPGVPLANILDAHGRQVTAEVTRSGLLAILTRTVGTGQDSGQPALNRENAVELRDALNDFIAREGP